MTNKTPLLVCTLSGKNCPLKKAAILFLKVAIPLALFAYLLWRVDPEHYRVFWEQPKRWDLMVLALATAFYAIAGEPLFSFKIAY